MRRGLLVTVTFLAACGGEAANATYRLPPPPSRTPPTCLPTAAQPKTVKRVVVSLSRKSGTNVTTIAADGSITVTLDVLVNGRGPHTDATLALAPDGTIARLAMRGHHD